MKLQLKNIGLAFDGIVFALMIIMIMGTILVDDAQFKVISWISYWILLTLSIVGLCKE